MIQIHFCCVVVDGLLPMNAAALDAVCILTIAVAFLKVTRTEIEDCTHVCDEEGEGNGQTRSRVTSKRNHTVLRLKPWMQETSRPNDC